MADYSTGGADGLLYETVSTTDWETHTAPPWARWIEIVNEGGADVVWSSPAQSGAWSASHAGIRLGPGDSTVRPLRSDSFSTYSATASTDIRFSFFGVQP